MKNTSTSSSKFAQSQLKKFGWKEGDGIGKTNQGIINPIKASLKFDNSGLGFNLSEELTKNWWDHLYNSTAKNIDEDRKDIVKTPAVEEIKAAPLNRKSYFYSRFQKGSTLIDGRTLEVKPEKTEEDVADGTESNSSFSKKISKSEDEKNKQKKLISDEDLFKLCNGRTAHKGARHGIKMNGKLSRIEEQEKIFLEKYAPRSKDTNEVVTVEIVAKTKKTKRAKEKAEDEQDEEELVEVKLEENVDECKNGELITKTEIDDDSFINSFHQRKKKKKSKNNFE